MKEPALSSASLKNSLKTSHQKWLRDHKIALIGEKIAEAASQKSVR